MTLPPAVMWVDPGRVTGMALLAHGQWFSADEHMFYRACHQIESTCQSWGSMLAIGWERFTITGQTHKKTPQPDAMHMIGVCRFMAERYHCRVLPEAQQASPSPLEKRQLQAIGWWVPGKDDAQSAAAHLLRYLLKAGEVPPREAEILAQVSGR
jgi:hypothetical protein